MSRVILFRNLIAIHPEPVARTKFDIQAERAAKVAKTSARRIGAPVGHQAGVEAAR